MYQNLLRLSLYFSVVLLENPVFEVPEPDSGLSSKGGGQQACAPTTAGWVNHMSDQQLTASPTNTLEHEGAATVRPQPRICITLNY